MRDPATRAVRGLAPFAPRRGRRRHVATPTRLTRGPARRGRHTPPPAPTPTHLRPDARPRRAALLLGAGAAPLAGAPGCGGARPASAAGRAAPAALAAAHLERLYFGRNVGDTAVVSDSAWAGFVRAVLTPAFPDGATVWAADGRWRAPDGTAARAPSFVVELVHAPTADAEARVRRVVAAYKRRFARQAVLRVVTAARAAL